MNKKITLSVLTLFVSGCLPEKPFYINEAKSVADMQRDYGSCAKEAELRYPVQTESYETDPSFEPIVTSCTSYSGTSTYTTRCSSSGGYVPSKTEYYDANEGDRIKHERKCIERKGYRLKNIPWCSSEVPKGEACWSGFDVDWRSVPILTISNGKIQAGNECLTSGTCSALYE